ncbi:MAG: PAS domain S-box protein [Sulfuricella sp.]|nr:PAS domain S-box protein [Sulfuricella sp.]
MPLKTGWVHTLEARLTLILLSFLLVPTLMVVWLGYGYAFDSIAAMLAFGALAFVAAMFFARRMVRPITRLTDAARDIAAGNLAARAVPEGRDEIARLAASFNAMTDQLESIHAELERRVGARTEELQAKDAQLREALSLNRSILMTSAVGIAAYRQDGQCVAVNPAFGEMVGGTEEQMLDQNFRRISSWQESGLLASAQGVLAGGAKVDCEVELTTTFGRHLGLHCQLSRFVSQGEPHLLLMIHDITAEKRVKQALLEREREFRTLAENVPDNIVRCDREGRVVYLNPALERTLGRAAGELVGTAAAPDGPFFALSQAMRQVAGTGESIDFEQVVHGADGEPHYHAIRIVAERGPDGCRSARWRWGAT